LELKDTYIEVFTRKLSYPLENFNINFSQYFVIYMNIFRFIKADRRTFLLHSDRCFDAAPHRQVSRPLLPDAPRPATIAAYYHPLAARRSAPHNQRMQQTIPLANKFASGLAPDPRRLSQKEFRE
jgi:hypothetical protein